MGTKNIETFILSIPILSKANDEKFDRYLKFLIGDKYLHLISKGFIAELDAEAVLQDRLGIKISMDVRDSDDRELYVWGITEIIKYIYNTK